MFDLVFSQFKKINEIMSSIIEWFLFEVKSVQNSDDGKAATVDRYAPEIVQIVIPEPSKTR